MNRFIAPALLLLAITLSGTANAAPKDTSNFVTQLFTDLARNGN
jgi:hypothetical protein